MLTFPLFLAVLLARSVLAFSASANLNIAVYWGQNSYGNQQRLSYYCALDTVDTVILSFVTGFPNLSLNFANMCGDTFSDGLLHCSSIGEDIKTCQEKGKLVLLSLGGASGSYGFTSDSEAEDFATVLWNKFGGGSDSERPFDDAIVDGFDFDLENSNEVGTVALGNKLREIFNADATKRYYLSAAPQCPYPDASSGELLAGVDIDFAFIQFYNNYCNLDTSFFNWNTWKDFAVNHSPNKDIKLYVGLPGAESSASTGYLDVSAVKQYLSSSIVNDPNFGGFMLWDASSGTLNTNAAGVPFIDQLYDYLEEELTNPITTSSISTSSTFTSGTSTTSSTTTWTPSTSSTTTAWTPSTSSTTTAWTPSTPTTSSTSGTSTTSTTATSTTTAYGVAPGTSSTLTTSSTTSIVWGAPTWSTTTATVYPTTMSAFSVAAEVPNVSTYPQTPLTTLTTRYVTGAQLTVTVNGQVYTSYVTRTKVVLTEVVTVRVFGRPTVVPRI